MFTELKEKPNTIRKLTSTNLKHHNPNDSPTQEDLSSFDNSENEQSDGNLSVNQQNERG